MTQAPHGAITWGNPATDAGSQRGRGRIHHICGVLTQDFEVNGVLSARMSSNFLQRRSDARKFHVQICLPEGCGAAGGEGDAAPLRHVRNAHAGRADAKASEDGTLFQEY